MENRASRQGIADVTIQAYASRQGVDTEQTAPRWWHVKTRIVVMTVVCIAIGSLICYWFVSSIIENQRDSSERNAGASVKPSHYEKLSNHVVPIDYTLKIVVVLEEGNFTATGDAEIQLHCRVPTSHIRLHARKLLIKSVSLKEYNAPNTSKAINKYVSADEDFMDIFLLQVLSSRKVYILRIKYTINLEEEPRGFFRSKYIDERSNETRWIAISNFSPDFARTAFPCFDEPWIKAPFRISVGRKSNMRSHSNSMRKFSEDINDMPGYVWDHYESTLPMPTYVVAFMVTDFSCYDIHVTERPIHRVFSRKEVQGSARYLGNLIPKVLRLIQNLTGFYYELDKLDVIAVPSLAYSAMENWGLITFREDTFVLKNDSIIEDTKHISASIAAHEVAHQWFGNLVTPKSWSDVWLKEGFSSFFGAFALSTVEPSQRLEDAFVSEYHFMFESDAVATVHPLHINLSTMKRLDGIFDGTSYVKGNCLVNMVFHFLGSSTFFSCVRRYVRTYYYRAADQEDLWNVFQEEIEEKNSLPEELTMTDVMKTWCNQPGFPVLRIEKNRDTGLVSLAQTRFYQRGINDSDKEFWYVPLTWTTEADREFGSTLPKAWMTRKYMEINDTALSQAIFNDRWILFNINQTGLYRVNYDMENWRLLTRSFKSFSMITKVQLLSDAFAMANADLIDFVVPWNILEKLENERNQILWTAAIVTLEQTYVRFWNSSSFKFAMCRLVDAMYNSEMKSVTWLESNTWTRFKVRLMKWACSMGHETCLKAARAFARRSLRNETSGTVPSEFRTWTYCVYAQTVTEAEWLSLLDKYQESETRHKDSLAYALGCHNNATLLKRYLALLFSRNVTTNGWHINLALRSTASNPYGYRVAIEFLTVHWKDIDKLEDKENHGSNVLYILSDYLEKKEDVHWLRHLKGANDKYDTVIDAVINRVETNDAWNAKHKNETRRIIEEIFARRTETRDCVKRRARGDAY